MCEWLRGGMVCVAAWMGMAFWSASNAQEEGEEGFGGEGVALEALADPLPRQEAQEMRITGLDYRLHNSQSWSRVSDTLVVVTNTPIQFRAVYATDTGEEAGQTTWSGVVSGTGRQKTMFCSLYHSGPLKWEVTATLGASSATAQVRVVYLETLKTKSRRTSTPAESLFSVKANEYYDQQGTFEFQLDMEGNPTPMRMQWELWDTMGSNEVLANGTGTTASVNLVDEYAGTNKTKQEAFVRFFSDINYTDDSTTGTNDPDFQQSPYFHVVKKKWYTLTYDGTGVYGLGDGAVDLVLAKHTEDDYRANVDLLLLIGPTYPGPRVLDSKAKWDNLKSLLINSPQLFADVSVIADITHSENGTALNGTYAGFVLYGKIFLNRGANWGLSSRTLIHEYGHCLKLPDLSDLSKIDHVMYERTGGNPTLLDLHEAKKFQGE